MKKNAKSLFAKIYKNRRGIDIRRSAFNLHLFIFHYPEKMLMLIMLLSALIMTFCPSFNALLISSLMSVSLPLGENLFLCPLIKTGTILFTFWRKRSSWISFSRGISPCPSPTTRSSFEKSGTEPPPLFGLCESIKISQH